MEEFYKKVKIIFVCSITFISVVFIPWIVSSMMDGDWAMITILLPFFLAMSSMYIVFFTYCRNIVVEVGFQDDNTILVTNSKVIVLPSKNFVEVIDSDFMGRTVLKYHDGTGRKGRKHFFFHKKYSLLKTNSLDFAEMRKHMTYAVFKH